MPLDFSCPSFQGLVSLLLHLLRSTVCFFDGGFLFFSVICESLRKRVLGYGLCADFQVKIKKKKKFMFSYLVFCYAYTICLTSCLYSSDVPSRLSKAFNTRREGQEFLKGSCFN
ncbi:uncharacterized protein LOC110640984 isoform X3 [Hevea brasiliensis]|uniref:uncharacterized protein LOC110640984 isoform X3 n=1 Tax=Hevea brasiliensis TaxID=3981 RepID=UPI0025FC5558|nr:uncharacterized protein LOC110640984 isoform X3 [Hevea brasiliensis]